MDSDDDYQSFSPPKESSPQGQHQRLKRLKKLNSKPRKEKLVESIKDPLLFPQVDYAKLEALENDSETLDFNESNLNDKQFGLQESSSQEFDDQKENEVENQKEKEVNLKIDAEIRKTKRALEFDDDVADGFYGTEGGIGDETDLSSDGFKKKECSGRDLGVAKGDQKKKKRKSNTAEDSTSKARVLNKRRQEKERKAYLQQLHAESQRLLRETRDATFRPIPVVQKPISSILEKIRKRKLEVSKNKHIMRNHNSYAGEKNNSQSDKKMNVCLVNLHTEEREASAHSMDVESSLRTSGMDGSEEHARQTSHEDSPKVASKALNDQPTPALRAPVDDTQDLFDDSEPSDNKTEQPDERQDSPLEEDIAPSLLAMNLKFDSAPADDSSSDEEDNDKENIDPHPRGTAQCCSSPKGDPVKDFVDDEAEEEDDSDNDQIHFEENEDEDMEDSEELNDIIAIEHEETTIDNEKRNELHQKWLEQQDAAGTDKLLHRLKCGSELRGTILHDKDPESEKDEETDSEAKEESNDEAKEDDVPRNSTWISSRKAKEIILQLLPKDKDVFLSDGDNETDNDDDDGKEKCAKKRLLVRAEKEPTSVPPADDESSREVFGLIKKLNIVSSKKEKPKASGGNGISSSKTLLYLDQNEYCSHSSSFLGRVSNLNAPSSHKPGIIRSFIFGRDDSNSRSSVSDDSAQMGSMDNQPTRNRTAKFSSSQSKFSSRNKDVVSANASNISLFDILKRSSSQSHVCDQERTTDLPKSVFASFRISKKPAKIEGRS